MTLYELTDDYLRLLEFAEDPECDPDVFADTMDAIEGGIEDKADGYAKVIGELSAKAEALSKEADRLANRKKAIENNIKRMKEHLTNCMVAIDKRKFKTDLFSFSVQKNQASVKFDVPEDEVPDEYMRIKREPDKTSIKKAIEAGEEITWAHLEQSEGVRIR